jgi:hypothetical protein
MKIVLRVVGPLFVAVGLFCFAQGTGLLTWPRNAAMTPASNGLFGAAQMLCDDACTLALLDEGP